MSNNCIRTLVIVLTLQLLLLGSVAMGSTGDIFLILRHIIAFVCLAIVPGYIILEIINIKIIDIVLTVIYSVGLSISFLMTLGFLTNYLLPLFGIKAPLSFWPLYISYLVAFFIISLIYYLKTKCLINEKLNKETQKTSKRKIIYYLMLAILPIFTIIGVILLDRFGNNLVLIIIFLLMVLYVVILHNLGDQEDYKTIKSVALFCFSLSLLYHYFMSTNYIVGYDVNLEYHFANLINTMGYWDAHIWNNYNAVLSTVILPVYFVKFMNIDLTWVFKLIFPTLFAIVPVILYIFFSLEFNDRIAFIASFFFLSFNGYFTLSSFKEVIAEVFLALFLVTIFNKTIPPFKRNILAIIYAISLIVSHYGLSCIVILLILFALIYSQIMIRIEKEDIRERKHVFTLLGITFIVLAITWYLYVSSSSGFITIVLIGQKISQTIIQDFGSANAMDPLLIRATGGVIESIWHKLSTIIYFTTILFIFIGVGRIVIFERIINKGIKNKYCTALESEGMAIASLIIMGLCVIVPYFASILNMDRFYQITLFFLAPYCVVGGLELSKIFVYILKSTRLKQSIAEYIVISVIILFYLFNTGIVYEIVGDTPQLMLGKYRMEQSKDPNLEVGLHRTLINDEEYAGVSWLSASRNKGYDVYGNYGDTLQILRSYGMIDQTAILSREQPINSDSYVYLGSMTVKDGYMYEPNYEEIRTAVVYPAEENHNLDNINDIYNNGGSEILIK